MMDWKNIGLILVALSQLGLSIFILIRNPRHKINLSFFLVPLAIFVWVFSTSQFLIATDIKWAEFLYKLKFSFGLLIAVFFQFFTIFFPYQKKKVNFFNPIFNSSACNSCFTNHMVFTPVHY